MMVFPGSRRCCNQKTVIKAPNSTTRLLVSLPLEILYNIFSRLIPRTLGRLKLVCRTLRDVINDPYFVLHIYLPFSRKTRPFILVADENCLSLENEMGVSHELLDLNACPALHYLSTCNGLVCYVSRKHLGPEFFYEYSFDVMNPITKEKMQLPSITCCCYQFQFFQLLWDEATGPWGVYKVLLIYRTNLVTKTMIFTLGRDCSWRDIYNPYKYWLYSDFFQTHIEHPCIGGAMHCAYDNVLKDADTRFGNDEDCLQFVAAFDIKHEKFREIKLPNECCPEDKSCVGGFFDGCHLLHVIDLRGLLCLLHFNASQKTLDAWLLVDYHGGKWMKEHSVNLDFLCLGFEVGIDVVAHLSDEMVLMDFVLDHPDLSVRYDKFTASYNPKMATVEKVDMGVTLDGCDILGGVFTESLVSLSGSISTDSHV